jgi:ferredoxin
MKAIVENDACIGSRNGEACCPKIFAVYGQSQVQTAPPPLDQEGWGREGVSNFPMGGVSPF